MINSERSVCHIFFCSFHSWWIFLSFIHRPVGMPKMEKVYLHNPSSEEISLISISATTSHFHASFFQNRVSLLFCRFIFKSFMYIRRFFKFNGFNQFNEKKKSLIKYTSPFSKSFFFFFALIVYIFLQCIEWFL